LSPPPVSPVLLLRPAPRLFVLLPLFTPFRLLRNLKTCL